MAASIHIHLFVRKNLIKYQCFARISKKSNWNFTCGQMIPLMYLLATFYFLGFLPFFFLIFGQLRILCTFQWQWTLRPSSLLLSSTRIGINGGVVGIHTAFCCCCCCCCFVVDYAPIGLSPREAFIRVYVEKAAHK